MYYDKIGEVARWLKQRPLVFFALLHALLFLAVFANLDYLVGGNSFERGFAAKILEGMVPYSDFASEYPPLALLSFLIPALLSPTQPLYDIFFALEIFLLGLVVLFILVKLAPRLKLQIWPVLSVYTLCLVAMGPIVTGRFDLLPATLVLVALYAFISGKNKIAWGCLELGASAKLYPLIIAPLLFLYLLHQKQYRRLAQGIAIFGGVILVLSLPWVIINADGFWQFLSYHLERGLHSESSYGSVILMGQVMGLTQVEAGLTYGSWNIISPAANVMAKSSFYITAAFLVFLYFIYIKILLKKPHRIDAKGALDSEAAQLILRCSILAVLIMLLTSKIFSPQFLIWLCPLIPLVTARWRYIPLLLFLVACAITQYIYPHNYIAFELFTPHLVVMLAIRNLLLVAMAVIYLLPMRSSPVKVEEGVANNHSPG
ncbi:MAG: glycosyltransferase 87 family protein [Dehalococcoidales bacterium]|nr:glycosyltransferase 87 family protein [Dehalococcoidales bacterium]